VSRAAEHPLCIFPPTVGIGGGARGVESEHGAVLCSIPGVDRESWVPDADEHTVLKAPQTVGVVVFAFFV